VPRGLPLAGRLELKTSLRIVRVQERLNGFTDDVLEAAVRVLVPK